MKIKFKNFSKVYKKKQVFNDQNIEINISDITIVTGESGVGKTTLCNCIYGIDTDYVGEISIENNEDIKISFMPQSNKLLDYMTVEENILSYTEVGYEEKLDSLLAALEISGLKLRKVSELSGGQKQRVNLVRSLINEPNLCILDEPTGSLDDITASSLIDLLKKISIEYETKFLIITHDIRFVKSFNDYILVENNKITVNAQIKDEEMQSIKQVSRLFNTKTLYKNSKKRNKKSLLFSGFIMSFFILIFCILSLFMISTSNEFVNTVNSFFGENGGVIKNNASLPPDDGECQMVGEYETCDMYGMMEIPGYTYFSQEELDYISSYEGIEQITYVYDVASAGNIQVTYNGTSMVTNPAHQAEAYQEATGDIVYDGTTAMQFAQLVAPVEELKNYGTHAVHQSFWDVKYGEVHELEQNEIVLPYSYAKVVAYESGVEVEELVGMTLTFEDKNTTDMYLENNELVFVEEDSTIDYTVAWIYQDTDYGAYIYLPYVEDQSLYTTDLDAMFMGLYYFYEGSDDVLEWMMNGEYEMLVERYEALKQDPSIKEEDLAYVEALIKINSDLDKKKASVQTGVQQVLYTLKPAYSQDDFAEYLVAGPMPLGDRAFENSEVLLANDAYNYNDDRIIIVIVLGFILMIILFFLQKLYFKDIYKELQLAKLLGFSKKERFNILFKFFILLIVGSLIVVIPISILIMILIKFLVVPMYLSISSFIIVTGLIVIFSMMSFGLNYILVLSQDPKKELHD